MSPLSRPLAAASALAAAALAVVPGAAGAKDYAPDALNIIPSGQYGSLPAGLDPQYMAGAMVGAGFEVGLLMLDRNPPDVEGAVAFVTALFLGGLAQLRVDPPPRRA